METAFAAQSREAEAEFRVVRPNDGELRWIQARRIIFYDTEGRPVRVVGVSVDVTDRKRAHVQLRAFTETLEEAVRERTRELEAENEARKRAEESLRQSQKMDAIGQLTGGIAHDFNNLLMAVLASLELMRKRLPDDPRLTTLLDNAVQGAERGATLTRRMLAFARRQELKQGPVDIQEMVRGMTELLQRALGPSVEIETRFPLGLRPIQADVNQMEMALLNLAVNSRDAMPNGGKITITARQENLSAENIVGLNPGSYVCLTVSDTGTGMDATTLQRAAEPFFTTKGTGKGTGLGLSMVHGMAQQSGGRFVLQSTPGKGTNAEIWLPVAEASSKPGNQMQHATHDATKQQRSLAVVVVDDDYLVLTNTVMMLEDLGHSVFAASSGGEALNILRREGSVDLVLTDQAMPQMTGVQLAEAIKREWPDLMVIIATGYAEMPPGAGRGLRKLSKPFSEAQLAAELALVRPRAQVMKHPNGVSSAG